MVFKKIGDYFRDSYAELKHIVWPTRAQVISHTILVILFSVLIAVILGSFDLLFGGALQKIILR